MKIGDLVKVRDLESSDYGVVIERIIRKNLLHGDFVLWIVCFVSLEYDLPYMAYELEVINENR